MRKHIGESRKNFFLGKNGFSLEQVPHFAAFPVDHQRIIISFNPKRNCEQMSRPGRIIRTKDIVEASLQIEAGLPGGFCIVTATPAASVFSPLRVVIGDKQELVAAL